MKWIKVDVNAAVVGLHLSTEQEVHPHVLKMAGKITRYATRRYQVSCSTLVVLPPVVRSAVLLHPNQDLQIQSSQNSQLHTTLSHNGLQTLHLITPESLNKGSCFHTFWHIWLVLVSHFNSASGLKDFTWQTCFLHTNEMLMWMYML